MKGGCLCKAVQCEVDSLDMPIGAIARRAENPMPLRLSRRLVFINKKASRKAIECTRSTETSSRGIVTRSNC